MHHIHGVPSTTRWPLRRFVPSRLTLALCAAALALYALGGAIDGTIDDEIDHRTQAAVVQAQAEAEARMRTQLEAVVGDAYRSGRAEGTDHARRDCQAALAYSAGASRRGGQP